MIVDLSTHGMTPVLIACNDAGCVVLIVQVPCSVRVDEHAIWIVHEILGEVSDMAGGLPCRSQLPTCGGLKCTLGRYGPV